MTVFIGVSGVPFRRTKCAFRMKELWSYMAPGFYQLRKIPQKIKKSQHLGDYEAAVMSLFGEQEIFVSMDIKRKI